MTRPRARQTAPALDGQFFGLHPLQDEHINVPGMYLAVPHVDTTKAWRTFALYESNLPDSGYEKRAEYSERATMGVVTTWTGIEVDHRLIDYANTITVEMRGSEDKLVAVTESEMLAGRNRFLVGREIIGAADVELISTNEFTGQRTYELSTLQRGIKDTFSGQFDMQHGVGDTVVSLDAGGLHFITYATSRIGEATYFKIVPGGGLIAEASVIPVTLSSRTLRPFCPVSVTGVKSGNDWIFAWERQYRRSVQYLDQEGFVDDDVEQYRIHILTSATNDIAKRTTVVTDTRTWTYTGAMQITDWSGFQSTVTIELMQQSSVLLYGNSTILTFP